MRPEGALDRNRLDAARSAKLRRPLKAPVDGGRNHSACLAVAAEADRFEPRHGRPSPAIGVHVQRPAQVHEAVAGSDAAGGGAAGLQPVIREGLPVGGQRRPHVDARSQVARARDVTREGAAERHAQVDALAGELPGIHAAEAHAALKPGALERHVGLRLPPEAGQREAHDGTALSLRVVAEAARGAVHGPTRQAQAGAIDLRLDVEGVGGLAQAAGESDAAVHGRQCLDLTEVAQAEVDVELEIGMEHADATEGPGQLDPSQRRPALERLDLYLELGRRLEPRLARDELQRLGPVPQSARARHLQDAVEADGSIERDVAQDELAVGRGWSIGHGAGGHLHVVDEHGLPDRGLLGRPGNRMEVETGVLHPHRVEDEFAAGDEAGGQRDSGMGDLEPVGGALDDEVPHLGPQASGHDRDALDGALRSQGRAQPRFQRAAEHLLREPSEGEEGDDDDNDAQDEEDDSPLSQRALTRCLCHYLAPVSRGGGRALRRSRQFV